MSPTDYTQYWKNAASRHVSIQHTSGNPKFLTYGVETVLTEFKNVGSPMMALEDPEYGIVDPLSDNVLLQMSGAVLVLKKCLDADYAEIEIAKQEMFEVAFDLFTKLQNDRRKATDPLTPSPEKLIGHLVLGSISVIAVGPVFDGWYGWRLNHVVCTARTDRLNPDRWQGESPWQM